MTRYPGLQALSGSQSPGHTGILSACPSHNSKARPNCRPSCRRLRRHHIASIREQPCSAIHAGYSTSKIRQTNLRFSAPSDLLNR
jgi:hypothetical protein